jgi:WD40 repeat protein
MISRGNIVYTGHDDSLVKARDIYSLTVIETYTGHIDTVQALCFDELFILYSAGYDGSIKKWNMASRSVAFSFENKNGSVSSLTINQNQLFVGLRSGRIDYFDTENSLSLKSLGYHSKTVSSLIAFNGSIYSSSYDGTVLKFPTIGDQSITTVYRSNGEPMENLSRGSSFWTALQGDSKIVIIHMESGSESVKVIDFQIPLVSVAVSYSLILAGTKSGIIYSWDIETLQLAFELKGHISPVNNLLVDDDRLFSASDDKTIIEWSLGSKTRSQTFQRLSASALGHLGPVNSLSYCSDTLFSAGSDLTVRRWNTKTGKHDDVYFGFTKSVTAVECYNVSIFAGSEDFSVLMFKPNLPQNQDVKVRPTTSILKRDTHQTKIVRLHKAERTTTNVSVVILSVAAGLIVIIVVFFVMVLLMKRSTKSVFQLESIATDTGTVSSLTITDLQTVVNSVMGISKHAAYLIENSALAKVKKIATGGGGELFLSKVMDPSLRKKHGEIVVQKIVFVKSKPSEEAFYQEVGIMIMLSTFPNFCQIIGYTENPLSMILKHYPNGSLSDWLEKNNYGSKIMLKILKETASALNIMHSHYLAHCDLKTQNILVEENNGLPSFFLADFGITQVLSESIIAAKAFNVINLRGLSITFAAPEAFMHFRTKTFEMADLKAFDIYSFGCLTYEVLARIAPWK